MQGEDRDLENAVVKGATRRLVSEVHELLSDNKPDCEANCSQKNQNIFRRIQPQEALVKQFNQTEGLKLKPGFVLLFQTRCKVLVSSSWQRQRRWYVTTVLLFIVGCVKESKAVSDSHHICVCRPSSQARKFHIAGKRLQNSLKLKLGG